MAEPLRRGQAERLQPCRTLLARIGKLAGSETGRRDDPHQSAPLAQRQQPSRCGLQQLIVVKPASGARNSVEPLISGIERIGQRGKIGFLGNGIGANQHALRADANRSGATLGGGQDPTRQQVADAIEFRAVARSARRKLGMARGRQDRRQRDVYEPVSRFGAANGRAANAPDRHRRPPTQRTALPASTFPHVPAKRAAKRKQTCNRNNGGLCHLQ